MGYILKLVFKECTLEDLSELRKISHKTYEDTYSAMNTSANMEAYLKKAFNITKLKSELSNLNSSFYFLYADGILAGYCKLNESDSQTDIYDQQSLEIERIYVVKKYHRNGFGMYLINKMISIATERGKSNIWLGVWQKNTKAISFYQASGFEVVSEHSFILGEDKQADFIMRKDLINKLSF